MSNKSTSSEEAKVFPIRDELVKTAVSFLQNPKVVSTPLAQKQKFLQRKGLTDEEIKNACEIAGSYDQELRPSPALPPSLPPLKLQTQLSLFDTIKEIVHNVAIFSIVGYALYELYQNYIAPFLFGKKKKTVEESIDELDKNLKSSVEELRNSLASVKVEVDKISQSSELGTEKYINELRSDISTVKGLLLSRKQFPSVSNSPVVPPSIPAWQMSSVPADSDHDADTDHKTEELEEMGSGSGSSEPEHCTKTSESSLEIIYSPKECEDTSFQKKNREDCND